MARTAAGATPFVHRARDTALKNPLARPVHTRRWVDWSSTSAPGKRPWKRSNAAWLDSARTSMGSVPSSPCRRDLRRDGHDRRPRHRRRLRWPAQHRHVRSVPQTGQERRQVGGICTIHALSTGSDGGRRGCPPQPVFWMPAATPLTERWTRRSISTRRGSPGGSWRNAAWLDSARTSMGGWSSSPCRTDLRRDGHDRRPRHRRWRRWPALHRHVRSVPQTGQERRQVGRIVGPGRLLCRTARPPVP